MYANLQIARAQPAVAGGTAQHVCQLSKTENKRESLLWNKQYNNREITCVMTSGPAGIRRGHNTPVFKSQDQPAVAGHETWIGGWPSAQLTSSSTRSRLGTAWDIELPVKLSVLRVAPRVLRRKHAFFEQPNAKCLSSHVRKICVIPNTGQHVNMNCAA